MEVRSESIQSEFQHDSAVIKKWLFGFGAAVLVTAAHILDDRKLFNHTEIESEEKMKKLWSKPISISDANLYDDSVDVMMMAWKSSAGLMKK